jgi:pimeloyl-ACP methyl ester carboxylesterase
MKGLWMQGGTIALRTALELKEPLAGVVGICSWYTGPDQVLRTLDHVQSLHGRSRSAMWGHLHWDMDVQSGLDAPGSNAQALPLPENCDICTACWVEVHCYRAAQMMQECVFGCNLRKWCCR